MSLLDLLERWADLGERTTSPYAMGTHPRVYLHSPGEADGWCVVHSGFAHGWRVDPNTDIGRAHILAAVIEAIEARGGGVRLELITDDDDDQEHWAIVHVRRPTFGRAEVRGASNAEAALAAYLAAYLKAVAQEAA